MSRARSAISNLWEALRKPRSPVTFGREAVVSGCRGWVLYSMVVDAFVVVEV